VFFNTMRRFSHVGIYVGDGNFIHAPAPVHRARGSMQSAYWARRFDGARRVQDSDGLGLDASKAALAMQMQASQLQ
jgi:hypothetical protein